MDHGDSGTRLLTPEHGPFVNSWRDDLSISSQQRDSIPLADTEIWQTYEPHRHDGPRNFWTPVSLRRGTVVAFAGTFVAILFTLIALYIHSARNHGLSTADTANHYFWTYGPTAVFMILGALWNQVQYRAMQLTPWILMSKGQVPASSGVLLDYISDWNVVTLFRAIKRRHILVSIAVICSLLLQALTAFATGLFTLSSVHTTHNANFLVTHNFNDTGYDPEAVSSEAYALGDFMNSFNLSTPVGATGKHAYQPFEDAQSLQVGDDSYAAGHSYEAEVDVLTLELDCENTTISTDGDGQVTASLPGTDCAADYYSLSPIDVPFNSTDEFRLNLVIADCANETGSLYGPTDVGEKDVRLWTYVIRQDPNGLFLTVDSEDGDIRRRYDFRSLVCKPRLRCSNGPVSIWRPEGGNQILSEIKADRQVETQCLFNVTAADLLAAAADSTSMSTSNMFHGIAYALLSTSIAQLEPFWNVTHLAQRVEDATAPVAAQVARKHLLQPAESHTQGTTSAIENRLIVRDFSFGMMVGILVLLIALTVLLVISHLPVEVCSRDPGSIGGLATILAQSPEFMATIRGMSTKPALEMHSLLSDKRYSTGTTEDGGFSIRREGTTKTTVEHSSSDPIKWWRPFSVGLMSRSLIFGLPIALIVAVETLYQHSNKSHGIAPVGGESPYVRYVWVYIPALTMLCVRALFQTVEFSARVFQPYHYLRIGGATGSSIMENQHRKISLHGLLSALYRRSFALSAASLTVLLAAFLPVIVSGLYTTRYYANVQESSLVELDRWAFRGPTGAPYYYAPEMNTVGAMVLHLNLSYPQWTYEDLVFPRVELAGSSEAVSYSSGHTQTRLSAVRGNLNCQEVQPDEYKYGPPSSLELADHEQHVLNFNITSNAPCGIPEISLQADVPSEGGYFSANKDMFEFNGMNLEDQGRSWVPYKSGCPTAYFAYGKADRNRKPETTTVIKCRPRIEEVEADVRLLLPSYEIDRFHPPSPDASSSRTLVDAYINTTNSLRGFIDILPNQRFMRFMLMDFKLGNAADGTQNLTEIMQTVLYNINGVGPDELLDPATFAQELTRVYGIVVAQTLNSGGRGPLDDSNGTGGKRDGHTYNATLVTKHLQLVQSRVSTRILEAVLAATILCGAVAVVFMDTRRVLPKNVCSIAAVGSLLADSKMLERDIIPRGAEWCDDKELKRRGVFEGRTFTLGWWDAARGMEGRGLDDGDERISSREEKRFAIDVDGNIPP